MGRPMAANLVKAGHNVRGFDLEDAALHVAEADGVVPVKSIAEAVENAEVVFTMLPKGEQVRTAFDDAEGIWAHAGMQALIVDSSTIDVETSQYCHDLSARLGFSFVDAPVSGGVSGAEAASLAFMVGGQQDSVTRAFEYIRPMAGKTIAA